MTSRTPTLDHTSERLWSALVHLEESVDALTLCILQRNATPKEPPRPTSKPPSRAPTQSGADLYLGRMAKLETIISTLRDCLEAPAQALPDQAQRRNLRRIVHPELSGNADTAKRARVGRAARRYGLSFKEWVDRYGMVDKHPERP